MNRKSLAVLLTVIMLFALMPAPALANVNDVFTDNGVTYKVLTESGTTGTVQVGDGADAAAVPLNTTSLTIPATVTNNSITYTVTEIGNNAFYSCTSLSSITCGQMTAPALSGTDVFTGVAATGTLNIPAGATGYTTANGGPWVSPTPAPAPAPATPGFTITVPTAPTAPTVNNPFTETPVLNPPIITDPTENKAVTALAQSTVTFSVTAKNATSYQWYVNRNDGNGFVAILGATGASHTTPALALSDNGCQYRCVASNSDGSAISPIFTLNASETIAPPQTGDTSAPVFIGIAMLLTGFAVSILIRRRSGREN